MMLMKTNCVVTDGSVGKATSSVQDTRAGKVETRSDNQGKSGFSLPHTAPMQRDNASPKRSVNKKNIDSQRLDSREINSMGLISDSSELTILNPDSFFRFSQALLPISTLALGCSRQQESRHATRFSNELHSESSFPSFHMLQICRELVVFVDRITHLSPLPQPIHV